MRRPKTQGCKGSLGLWEATWHCDGQMLTREKWEEARAGGGVGTHGDPTLPLRSPLPMNCKEVRILEEQLSALRLPGGFLPVPGLQGHRCAALGKSGRPGRTPGPALPCSVFPRKSLSLEGWGEPLSPFRTTSPRSQAPCKSKSLCTVPVTGAQAPQGWRELGVKGALPSWPWGRPG